ncbi:MAG: hypothetical protein JNJ46_03120 [Myxococcales bacterium]|nr:hypothetical protein [Myxococcales bacterium]
MARPASPAREQLSSTWPGVDAALLRYTATEDAFAAALLGPRLRRRSIADLGALP